MAKKKKQPSQKAAKKLLLKEIVMKLTDTVKGYHKNISDKKLGKQIHKAGQILTKSLTKEQITVVHKEKTKRRKRQGEEKEVAS
jgi:hypothetical protein